jgi:hypothetical protein
MCIMYMMPGPSSDGEFNPSFTHKHSPSHLVALQNLFSPQISLSSTHSTHAGGPAAPLAQVPPAWQTGAEPGRGTAPLLQEKEQVLPATAGVVQLKVPELTPVIRELAGRLAHPGKHGKCEMRKAFWV